jgi:hypothetical protein
VTDDVNQVFTEFAIGYMVLHVFHDHFLPHPTHFDGDNAHISPIVREISLLRTMIGHFVHDVIDFESHHFSGAARQEDVARIDFVEAFPLVAMHVLQVLCDLPHEIQLHTQELALGFFRHGMQNRS